jgi:hypothetical protein
VTGAKALLANSVQLDMFLVASEDFGTRHGTVAHYGTAFRATPYNRRRMGYRHWCEYEMVAPNTRWSNGPESVRRFTGQDAGWRLPKRWKVLDLDETKSGRHRSLATILEELPEPVFCVVPSRTAGHWQVWFYLHTPSTDELADRRLRSSVELWGGDPSYVDTTLAWNPVHRSLVPTMDWRTTWWNPEVALGVLPMITLDDLRHPDCDWGDLPSGDVDESVRGALPAHWADEMVGSRQDLEELVEAMALLGEGCGRRKALGSYVWRAGCHRRKELGRDLTYEEALAIAQHGNSIFRVPKDRSTVEEQARFFLSSRRWELQAYRVREANLARSQEAKVRDQQLLLKLDYLKYHFPSSLPDGACNTLSEEELARASAYSGRPGTYAHLAHVIRSTPGAVRVAVCRARRRSGEAA